MRQGREFEEMVRMHQSALLAVATRLCRNPAQAHDRVQDAYERALKSFHALQPGTNTRSWLMAILRNRFIDSWRHAAATPRSDREIEQLADVVPEAAKEDAPAWADITQEQLKGAIDKLRDDYRAVYVLHSLEGHSYNEIAAKLDIPQATVGTRIFRARKKLKDLLMPHLAQEVLS